MYDFPCSRTFRDYEHYLEGGVQLPDCRTQAERDRDAFMAEPPPVLNEKEFWENVKEKYSLRVGWGGDTGGGEGYKENPVTSYPRKRDWRKATGYF